MDLSVTDDTDLVACGAPAILYKFSDLGLAGIGGGGGADGIGGTGGKVTGGVTGQFLLRSGLSATPSPLSLMDFCDVMPAALFVAAGCDYCPSLRGVGVVTARKCVKEAFHGYGPGMLSCEADGENPINRRTSLTRGDDDREEPKLSKLFRLLYSAGYGGKQMTTEERAEYEDDFCKALIMYRHPVVFDPIGAKCVVVNDPAKGGADRELITFEPYADLVNDPAKLQAVVGKVLDPARAALIAEGQINARSGKRFDEEDRQQPQEGQEQAESVAAPGPVANVEAAPEDNAAIVVDAGEEKMGKSDKCSDTELAHSNSSDTADGDAEDVQEILLETQPEIQPETQEPLPVHNNRFCRIDRCKKRKQTDSDGMCRAHFREHQKKEVEQDELKEADQDNTPENEGPELERRSRHQQKDSTGKNEAAAEHENKNSNVELHLETQADLNLESQAEAELLDTAMGDNTIETPGKGNRTVLKTKLELPDAAMDDDATSDSASEEQPLFETQAPFPEIQNEDEPALPAASAAAAAAAEEDP